MKNKLFIISILIVFLMSVIMALIGYLEKFTFFYVIKNNKIAFMFCFILLDILTVYTVMELVKVTCRWAESESYVNIIKSHRYILISILIVFGFNIWGVVYSILFRMNLGESLLSVTFNAYVLCFMTYLLFKSLFNMHHKIGNLKS